MIKRLFIDFRRAQRVFEDRLDLRGEDHASVFLIVVERFDADAIARQHELGALGVPDRDRKVAFNFVDRKVTSITVNWQFDEIFSEELLMQFDAHYDFLTSNADTFFFLTDKDAPKGRVVAMPLQETKAGQWSVVVPENADTLQRVKVIGDRLVLVYLQDACHRLLAPGADHRRVASSGPARG